MPIHSPGGIAGLAELRNAQSPRLYKAYLLNPALDAGIILKLLSILSFQDELLIDHGPRDAWVAIKLRRVLRERRCVCGGPDRSHLESVGLLLSDQEWK